MLGSRQKREACTVAVANQPLLLGVLEEDEEPCRILEIVEHNVAEYWGRCGGCPGGRFRPVLTTSRFAAGGGWRWTGRGGLRRVRRWSGLLVFEFLQGFLVYTRGG